ncbi:hypothetical protein ACWD25_32545, partial [Streptomyces sp. NPDC002920]
ELVINQLGGGLPDRKTPSQPLCLVVVVDQDPGRDGAAQRASVLCAPDQRTAAPLASEHRSPVAHGGERHSADHHSTDHHSPDQFNPGLHGPDHCALGHHLPGHHGPEHPAPEHRASAAPQAAAPGHPAPEQHHIAQHRAPDPHPAVGHTPAHDARNLDSRDLQGVTALGHRTAPAHSPGSPVVKAPAAPQPRLTTGAGALGALEGVRERGRA